MEGLIAKFIVEAVAAAALLVGFILFMRGLKDQRSSFQVMMEAQQEILAAHTQESKELSRGWLAAFAIAWATAFSQPGFEMCQRDGAAYLCACNTLVLERYSTQTGQATALYCDGEIVPVLLFSAVTQVRNGGSLE